MARAAAAVLAAPERHAGMSYRPTGPELLSGRDMAAIIATVVGHRVLPIDLPFWMFTKVARQQHVDPIQISGFRHYVEDNEARRFRIRGRRQPRRRGIDRPPAESFETTARRYAAMPFARQTFGNRVKAFVNFNLTPFYPGYDLERMDRQTGFPTPPNPSLSIDDRALARGPQPAERRPAAPPSGTARRRRLSDGRAAPTAAPGAGVAAPQRTATSEPVGGARSPLRITAARPRT